MTRIRAGLALSGWRVGGAIQAEAPTCPSGGGHVPSGVAASWRFTDLRYDADVRPRRAARRSRAHWVAGNGGYVLDSAVPGYGRNSFPLDSVNVRRRHLRAAAREIIVVRASAISCHGDGPPARPPWRRPRLLATEGRQRRREQPSFSLAMCSCRSSTARRTRSLSSLDPSAQATSSSRAASSRCPRTSGAMCSAYSSSLPEDREQAVLLSLPVRPEFLTDRGQQFAGTAAVAPVQGPHRCSSEGPRLVHARRQSPATAAYPGNRSSDTREPPLRLRPGLDP